MQWDSKTAEMEPPRDLMKCRRLVAGTSKRFREKHNLETRVVEVDQVVATRIAHNEMSTNTALHEKVPGLRSLDRP